MGKCMQGDYLADVTLPGDGGTTKACRRCQPGRYSNATGATSCQACPLGKHTHLARTECVQFCKKGAFLDENACKYCPSGKYQASSQGFDGGA
jgi:hypothetical protein